MKVRTLEPMDFTTFPKIELHLHLDCSLSYELVRKLAPGVSKAAYEHSFIAPPRCHDLADYLTRAVKGIELMQDRRALRLVTLDLLEQLQRDGLIYAEIRFAPLLHTEKGLRGEEVVKVVTAALEEGCCDTELRTGLILCTLRKFSEEQGLETVELAHAFREKGVVGVDLAGDEAGYPLQPHLPALGRARELNLPATAHAGEALGAESVARAIEELGVKRVGHGVRAAEDPAVLQLAKEHGIHFEICPTSNVQTGIFPDMKSHVIGQLYRSGFPLSINTDSRTLSNVTLSEEYNRLHQAFGWKKEDFLACNRYAADAAFAEENVKAELRAYFSAGEGVPPQAD